LGEGILKEPGNIGHAVLAGILMVILVNERTAEWLRDIGYRIRGKKPPPAVWRAPIHDRKGW
jgi:hypothetical protein